MTTNIVLKIVLDTNMFISGFLFHGMVKTVFDLVLENKLRMYTSSKLKVEIVKKFKNFNVTEQEQNEALSFLDKRGILVDPKIKITVCRDPKDNFILELAETAHADFIITRDKDLLDLPNQKWKNAKIIKPETFLPFLRRMKLI